MREPSEDIWDSKYKCSSQFGKKICIDTSPSFTFVCEPSRGICERVRQYGAVIHREVCLLLLFHLYRCASQAEVISHCLYPYPYYINPLSPKSDKNQFSLNIITTKSREKVMRISKMITIGKMH